MLTELADSGDALVKSFNVFLTYPFVDEVVGRDPQVARNLHMGDYTNLSITLDIDLSEGLPDAPGIPNIPCIELEQIPDLGPLPPLSELCEGAVDAINECLASPSLENCEGLPDFLVDSVCDELPVPLLCKGVEQGQGGGQLPPIELPDLGLTLDGQGGLLRPAPGFDSGVDPVRGPTMGQLSQAFDAGLVSLLVPGMVVEREGAGR